MVGTLGRYELKEPYKKLSLFPFASLSCALRSANALGELLSLIRDVCNYGEQRTPTQNNMVRTLGHANSNWTTL